MPSVKQSCLPLLLLTWAQCRKMKRWWEEGWRLPTSVSSMPAHGEKGQVVFPLQLESRWEAFLSPWAPTIGPNTQTFVCVFVNHWTSVCWAVLGWAGLGCAERAHVCLPQVKLAEALLRPPRGPVAGLSAQRPLQLCPGGLRRPGGALPVAGAAHRHQTPAM